MWVDGWVDQKAVGKDAWTVVHLVVAMVVR